MRIACCALGTAACLIAGRAEADVSKAWAAAKDNLPATTQFVVAIDVAALSKTTMFPKAAAAFASLDRDFDEVLGLIKSSCGWDAFSVIDGVVIAGDLRGKDAAGVAYVQLNVDRTKVSACLASTLTGIKKSRTVTVKQDGIYTVASIGTRGRDSGYFPWVAPNVVAVAIHPDKKAVVDAWIGQKGFGTSPAAAMLAKLDAKAVVAFAFSSDKPIDRWLPITRAYANWILAGGKLSGLIVATATDAKTAQGLADEFTKEARKGDKRPAVNKVMSSLTFTASGDVLTMKGTATESDLGDAFGEAFTKKRKKEPATVSKPAPSPSATP